MNIDYNIQPPHDNYVATLTIKGTKADFVALGLMLQKSLEEPAENEEDLENIRKANEVLEEIDQIINYLSDIEDNLNVINNGRI